MKKFLLILLFITPIISCNKNNFNQKDVKEEHTSFKTNAEKILFHLRNPKKDYVLIVAHRGDWTYAPENSLEAIKRCIEMGIDIAEIDVQKTKDGQMVLMHDYNVDRTTNGTGNVSDFTLKEIRELRLKNNCGIQGSRQQVPTLEEVMLLAKDKIVINLDKTEGETLKEAYEILKKTGTVHQATFKGNDSIQFMRNKYGTLLDSIIYMPKVWNNIPNLHNYIDDFNHDLKPIAYEMLFDNVESPVFSAIKTMNAKKITVLNIALWDNLVAGHTDEQALLESPDAAWGRLIENGANAIMTDRPAEPLKYLRSKGLHD